MENTTPLFFSSSSSLAAVPYKYTANFFPTITLYWQRYASHYPEENKQVNFDREIMGNIGEIQEEIERWVSPSPAFPPSTGTTSMPLALNHISFVCKSVAKSVEFYYDVLGFVLIKRPSSFKFEGAWYVSTPLSLSVSSSLAIYGLFVL